MPLHTVLDLEEKFLLYFPTQKSSSYNTIEMKRQIKGAFLDVIEKVFEKKSQMHKIEEIAGRQP